MSHKPTLSCHLMLTITITSRTSTLLGFPSTNNQKLNSTPQKSGGFSIRKTPPPSQRSCMSSRHLSSLWAQAKTTARTYANVRSQQETVLWHLRRDWQMLQTDTHHWTFVSLQQDCGYHGLRFGGFSPVNEILTPWQSSDRDKTEQYELSLLILLHVCNCSLWKWDGSSLANRHLLGSPR